MQAFDIRRCDTLDPLVWGVHVSHKNNSELLPKVVLDIAVFFLFRFEPISLAVCIHSSSILEDNNGTERLFSFSFLLPFIRHSKVLPTVIDLLLFSVEYQRWGESIFENKNRGIGFETYSRGTFNITI